MPQDLADNNDGMDDPFENDCSETGSCVQVSVSQRILVFVGIACLWGTLAVVGFWWIEAREREDAQRKQDAQGLANELLKEEEQHRLFQRKADQERAHMQREQRRADYKSNIGIHYAQLQVHIQKNDYKKARSKIEEISEMGQFEHEDVRTLSRQVTTHFLLQDIDNLPPGRYRRQRSLYKLLVSMNPHNQFYADKLAHVKQMIVDEPKRKEIFSQLHHAFNRAHILMKIQEESLGMAISAEQSDDPQRKQAIDALVDIIHIEVRQQSDLSVQDCAAIQAEATEKKWRASRRSKEWLKREPSDAARMQFIKDQAQLNNE